MAKHSRAGFPDPKGAGRGNPRAWTALEVCLHMQVARDGWASGWGFGEAAGSRHRELIGLSMRLGRGGFSWRSVLSLVPGIWEAPSVRD